MRLEENSAASARKRSSACQKVTDNTWFCLKGNISLILRVSEYFQSFPWHVWSERMDLAVQEVSSNLTLLLLSPSFLWMDVASALLFRMQAAALNRTSDVIACLIDIFPSAYICANAPQQTRIFCGKGLARVEMAFKWKPRSYRTFTGRMWLWIVSPIF